MCTALTVLHNSSIHFGAIRAAIGGPLEIDSMAGNKLSQLNRTQLQISTIDMSPTIPDMLIFHEAIKP